MTEHTCQETTGMIGEQYIRCGKTAYVLVQHVGRSEGPYWLCAECADHNIRRRGGRDITGTTLKKEA